MGETSAWIATFAFPWQPVSKHMVTPYTNHDVDTPVEVYWRVQREYNRGCGKSC